MPRITRIDMGNYCYHVINRANTRLPMFFKEEDYLSSVNTPQSKEEEESIRGSVVRGKPFGADVWVVKMIKKFGLEATVRSTGRPKKGT